MHKGSNLPDGDHVVRHISPSRLIKDLDGKVIGIYPQGIALRSGEAGLSVNWLEYFTAGDAERVESVVKQFRSNIELKRNSAFAIANVGKVKSVFKSSSKPVRIVYAPTKHNQAHAEILNYPENDLLILEALVTEAFTKLIRNSEFPEVSV